MDSRLLTNQYSTRPDGKNRKNPVKMMGRNIITFAWMGSGGVGLSRCCRNIDPPMSTGRTKNGSCDARSFSQNMKLAWRSSTVSSSTQ